MNLSIIHDVYILVRGDITIIGSQLTQVPFKNCTPFVLQNKCKCITKMYYKKIYKVNVLQKLMKQQ